ALPTFTPTSSPELDALLSTFRTNVFLPAQLLAPQQSLVYKIKNHRLLTNPEEPATVKLGNEVHQLKPLNHITDEPGTQKSLKEIVDLMRDGRDWMNMVALLRGLRLSGRKVKGHHIQKIVRKMAETGNQGVLTSMLMGVNNTGVKLWGVGICREVFWGGVLKCVQSGWSEEGVREAEKLMETWWDMLSEERHVDKEINKLSGDPKLWPDIIGLVLWVRAVRSVLFEEKKDEDGKVKRAAEMVVALWKNADLSFNEQNWSDANNKLMRWAPVWHGMKMAQKVLGENTPLGRDLGGIITQDLEPTVNKAWEVVSSHANDTENAKRKPRSLIVYDELSKITA
ncbi:MAG: hypothetical protein Q9225_003658, partial [Loekoesia sp. 1 TL-2023]